MIITKQTKPSLMITWIQLMIMKKTKPSLMKTWIQVIITEQPKPSLMKTWIQVIIAELLQIKTKQMISPPMIILVFLMIPVHNLTRVANSQTQVLVIHLWKYSQTRNIKKLVQGLVRYKKFNKILKLSSPQYLQL